MSQLSVATTGVETMQTFAVLESGHVLLGEGVGPAIMADRIECARDAFNGSATRRLDMLTANVVDGATRRKGPPNEAASLNCQVSDGQGYKPCSMVSAVLFFYMRRCQCISHAKGASTSGLSAPGQSTRAASSLLRARCTLFAMESHPRSEIQWEEC